MKTVFLLDAALHAGTVAESLQPIGPAGNAFDYLRLRIERLRSRFSDLVLVSPPGFPDDEAGKFRASGFDICSDVSPEGLPGLLGFCRKVLEDRSADHAALFYADSPLLDSAITAAVLDLHLSTGAEYTFPDNLPDGLAPEILSKDFVGEISSARPKHPEIFSRRIFENIDADINRWFAEVWLPEEDVSLQRLFLHTDTQRNRRTIAGILSKDPDPDYRSVCGLLRSTPSLFRIWPRYVEFEAVNRGRGAFGLPVSRRPETRLDSALFRKICGELSAGMPDVIGAFAGPGEALLHPDCLSMVEYAAKDSGLASIILETDGVHFDASAAERISNLPPSRCQVIFRVDAIRPATYAALHPGSELQAVTANIERFLSLREENRLRSFVQFVKYRENLPEMEEFWKFWESRKMPVIIQKSNDYAGAVRLEKVSDLTPLDRTVCWHIRRDLTVLSDGRVPVCKQDWDGADAVADLRSTEVRKVWELLEPYHLENVAEGWKRPGCLNPRCAKCDEWYAYNF